MLTYFNKFIHVDVHFNEQHILLETKLWQKFILVKNSSLFETLSNIGVTAVEPQWIPLYAPNLCTFSKPLEELPPTYSERDGIVVCHMTCTFGKNNH